MVFQVFGAGFKKRRHIVGALYFAFAHHFPAYHYFSRDTALPE
jgi:hypothetical protein